MVVPLYSSECCPIVDEINMDVRCLMKGLCCELTKIENKHKKAFTSRLRIHELAIPPLRKRAERFVRTCACKFPKPVELIRMEKMERTRTTQLALPQVRKLLLSQKALNKVWENPFRNYILNRLIRSSLLSLYSHLANVQPPKEQVKIHKWDKDEWKVHRKYLKKLAKHKVPPPVPKIVRKRMPLSAMFRYKKLAIPKFVVPKYVPEVFSVYPIKPKPPPSLTKLIQQKIRVSFDDGNKKRNPLNYGPATKIPPKKGRPGGGAERKAIRDPFTVARKALTAIPTERLVQLSQPRRRIEIKESAPIINRPKRVSTKITPRLEELAAPRKRRKMKTIKTSIIHTHASYIQADKLKELEKSKKNKKIKKKRPVKKDESSSEEASESEVIIEPLSTSSKSITISESEIGFWNNSVYEPEKLIFKTTTK